MALAISHAGEGTNTTGTGGTTQWSFQVGATFSTWDYIVISIASDNAGTSGASSVASVEDDGGNVYVLIGSVLHSDAAAVNDSGTCHVYAAQVTTALASTDLIYVNQSPATNRGAAVLHKATVASNKYVSFPYVDQNNSGTSYPNGYSLGTPAIGDGIIASTAVQHDAGASVIDTDSLGGVTWCSPTHTAISDSGSASTSQAIIAQHKDSLSSAVEQIYTVQFGASRYWELVGVILRESDAEAPGAPVTLLASAVSTSQIDLSWTSPGTPAGGRVITDYVVQYAIAGSGSWVTFADGTSAATTCSVTGLSNNTNYDFRVAAVNAISQGVWSATTTRQTFTTISVSSVATLTTVGSPAKIIAHPAQTVAAIAAVGEAVASYQMIAVNAIASVNFDTIDINEGAGFYWGLNFSGR
jgi:hypothetical protein